MLKNRNRRRKLVARRRGIPRQPPIVGRDRTVVDSGKTFINASLLAATYFIIRLNPLFLGARLAALCQNFEQYRFTALTINCYSSTADYAVNYLKNQPAITPTTIAIVMQSTASRLVRNTLTVPTKFNLNRTHLLAAAYNWWDCNNATLALSDQGLIGLLSAPVASVELEISYIVQFRGNTNPSQE